MPYVQRDTNGAIDGLYANAQAGFATEWLDDSDAAVVAFLAPPAPTLPDLQPFQFQAMLALSGHAPALDAYIAGLPDPQKTIAQAKLDHSLSFQRSNALVLAAQAALGLTDAQMDSLWAQAAAIS